MNTILKKIATSTFGRIFLGFGALLVASGLVQGLYIILTDEPPLAAQFDMVPALGQSLVALLVYYMLFRRLERRRLSELSQDALPGDLALGLVVGALLQGLTIATIFLSGGATLEAVNPVSALIPAAGMALSAAVLEELLFRGVLFRLINARFGSLAALAVSAAFFGAVHLDNPGATPLSAIMIAIEAGILLGAAYLYSNTLWLPIGIHFAWNFVQSGIFSASTSGMSLPDGLLSITLDGPQWLTGGAFGPEMSYQAVAFCLLAALLFLGGARKRGHYVAARLHQSRR